jgi:hypothetical protein
MKSFANTTGSGSYIHNHTYSRFSSWECRELFWLDDSASDPFKLAFKSMARSPGATCIDCPFWGGTVFPENAVTLTATYIEFPYWPLVQHLYAWWWWQCTFGGSDTFVGIQLRVILSLTGQRPWHFSSNSCQTKQTASQLHVRASNQK